MNHKTKTEAINFDLTGWFIYTNILCCGYHSWLHIFTCAFLDIAIFISSKIIVSSKNLQ